METEELEKLFNPASEWRALLEAAVDGIVVIDHRGIVMTFNRAAERLFGYEQKEVIGQNVSMLMPEPYHSEHDSYLDNYCETGQPRIIGIGREVVARRKDGSTIPIDLSVGEAPGNDGPPHFVGVIRDISERKVARESLQKEHELNRSYLELAQVLLVNLDMNGLITTINRRGLEVLGYAESELVGHDWFEICLADKERPRCKWAFERLLAGAEDHVEYFECAIQTKHGEPRIVEWRSKAVRDSEGKIVGTLSSGLDVTSRVSAQEEIRHARERLAQFGRLGIIGEMAAGLAHELNQPLTAIAAYVQACRRLLEAGKIDVDELLQTARKINTQALRAGEVIRRLRKFVKTPDSGRQICDMNALVQEIAGLAELDAKNHGIHIIVNESSEPLFAKADEVQIQQVILNLVRNAIDAMAEHSDGGGDLIINVLRENERTVKVAVVDSGIGVSSDAAERLFDPFYTTKSHGMGLGLPMCRSIMNSHGGRLNFQPNETVGSTFYLTLPVTEEHP